MPPPKVTTDGKYVCTVDNTVFDNEDDYDQALHGRTHDGGRRQNMVTATFLVK